MSGRPTVRAERKADFTVLTLDRPELRNAMSLAMVDELLDALGRAEEGGSRGVVLKGAGGHFCAGGDLKDMGAARMAPKGDGDPIAKVSARFGTLCVAFAETGLPVIALLEGSVMGGGFGLACVADVAIARDTAVFGLPETGLGLIPAQIAPFLVERLGYSQAKRLAVTGGRFGAAEAERIGLVHHVAESDEAMNALLAGTMDDIRKAAPGALAKTKALVRKARFSPPDTLVDHAASIFADASRGDEAAEGIAAFMEKRAPSWARGGEE